MVCNVPYEFVDCNINILLLTQYILPRNQNLIYISLDKKKKKNQVFGLEAVRNSHHLLWAEKGN